ncbi:BMA-RFS-1 [Dirofilaria immitis]|nr:BMA-RFS-1 [Dirofilaria immitis]
MRLRRYAVMVVACCSYKLRDDGVIVQGKYMQYEQNEVASSIKSMRKIVENLVLIVIDSIGAALAFTALAYFEGGRRAQDEIIGMLHYIAHRGCAIVTTNHFVYWRGKPSPSLGKRWIKAVDFRYLLCKLSDSSYYMQVINPKDHKTVGDKAFYIISNKGIDSLIEESHMVRMQHTEAVIMQNWNTIQQIYA